MRLKALIIVVRIWRRYQIITHVGVGDGKVVVYILAHMLSFYTVGVAFHIHTLQFVHIVPSVTNNLDKDNK